MKRQISDLVFGLIVSIALYGTINYMSVQAAESYAENLTVEVTSTGEYIGHVNSELLKFSYDNETNYISGEIVIVEWVNGVSTVPSEKPIITFDAVDGSESIDVFVTPTGTNTYYFDRLIADGLTLDKEYIFNVTSGNELNISEYTTVPIYTGTSSIGTEGVLGYVNDQDVCFKTDSGTGYLVIYGKTGETYKGHVNSVLTDISCVKSELGNFISGEIVIVEWINGVSTVPMTTPKMTFESVDGTECMDVFLTCLDGSNTYYFDRNLTDDMDPSKEYIFRITLTENRNVSEYKSMVATTNYMDDKGGILWSTDTQYVAYKTTEANGDNQMRILGIPNNNGYCASGNHSFVYYMLSEGDCQTTPVEFEFCSICGGYNDLGWGSLGPHKYVRKFTQEPTCLLPGKFEDICSVCGSMLYGTTDWLHCIDKNEDGYCDFCGINDCHRCFDDNGDFYCDICENDYCLDNDNDFYCDICKYHKCLDNDSNGYCDFCEEHNSRYGFNRDGFEYTTFCRDSDKDGDCDICKEHYYCIDTDKDGFCDFCETHYYNSPSGRANDLCIDNDGDGYCDLCLSRIFIDNDGDGYCDLCENYDTDN